MNFMIRTRKTRSARQTLGVAALAIMLAGLGGLSTLADPGWTKDPTRVDKGAIEISLTPKGVVDGRFRIAVSVNTHSGDLRALDLRHNAILHVGASMYQPMREVKLSGHHGTGELEFPLTAVPDAFEIEIHNVATGSSRVFRWP